MTRAGAKASGVLFGLSLCVLHAGKAQAQDATVSAGYPGLPTKSASSEGGFPVGEGSRLHVGVGTEVGYDSNVFFQPSNTIASPLLRVLPFVELSNQTSSRESVGIFYDLAASLQYRHLFSDNDQIDQSGIRDTVSPSLTGILDFSQAQQFGLALTESFSRTEEAPYIPGLSAIVRDANLASVQLRWSPGGGRIQGSLRYSNRLDFFEDDTYRSSKSMRNDLLLDLSWRWFPKTALFVSVQQGYVHYLADDTRKVDSYPLETAAGIRGLITEKLTAAISAGYTNGFYNDGRNPSGLGLVSGRAELAYRPTQMTSMSVGYEHRFENSLVGNFYNTDLFHAAVRQTLSDRMVFTVFGHYEYRRFDAPADPLSDPGGLGPHRVDNYLSAGASADYYLKAWAYLGVAYNVADNSSNAQYGNLRAEYVKHQVFGRLGITY
jgi:hypothetical protein